MKLRALDWLVCPRCGAGFRVCGAEGGEAPTVNEASAPTRCSTCRIKESPPHEKRGYREFDCEACYGTEILGGQLVCGNGHAFPVRDGVPRLRLDSGTVGDSVQTTLGFASRAIAASFGREWKHFDPDLARTWHQDLDQRCALFLQETASCGAGLHGKVILDAGCGNGSLSRGINRYGCEVLAVDASDSVVAAFRHHWTKGNGRTHFVQADLAHPPFRPRRFDVVYSSGVLHHNPDTREAFERLELAVKPGGKYYVWLYHDEPGLKFSLQLGLRSVIAPLPAPLKHAFVVLWSAQSMIRQRIRRLLGSHAPEDQLSWRERIIDLLDIYTPRYRRMHTQDEVKTWYRDLGYEHPETTEVRKWGFGILGVKPAASGVKPVDRLS